MNRTLTYHMRVFFILAVTSLAVVHLIPQGEYEFEGESLTRTKSGSQSSTYGSLNTNEESHTRNKRWTPPLEVVRTEAANNRWWDDAKISLLKSHNHHSTGTNPFKGKTDQQLNLALQRTSPENTNGVSTTLASTSYHPFISHLRVPGRSPTYFLQEPIGIPKSGLQYFIPEDHADQRPLLSNWDQNHTDSSQGPYGGRSHSEGEVRERLVLSQELKRRRVNDNQERVSGFLEPDSFFGNLNSSINVFSVQNPASANFGRHKSDGNATQKATVSQTERNLLEGKVFRDEKEILRGQNISNGAKPTVEYVHSGVNYVVPKVDYAQRTGEFSESKVRYVQPHVLYIDPKVDYVKSGVDYVHRHIDNDYDDSAFHEGSETTTQRFAQQLSSLDNRPTEIPSEYNTPTENPNAAKEFQFHSPLQLSTDVPSETYYYDLISPDLEDTKFRGDIDHYEPEAERKQHVFRSGGPFHFNENFYSANGRHNLTESTYLFEGLLDAEERYPQNSREINSEIDVMKKEDVEALFNNRKSRTSSRLTISDNDPENIEPNIITTSRRSDTTDSVYHETDSDFDNSYKEGIYEAANTTVWGIPRVDYPVYDYLPETSFSCAKRRGYYGDVSTRCQVFHVCQGDGRMHSFLCPAGTVFNQKYLVCDWWYNVDCDSTPQYYDILQILFDDDAGETEDNVNSAATYKTQKPKETLTEGKGEDLETAGGYVGGLKPFIPPKEFPIHVVKFTPVQVEHHGDTRIAPWVKSTNSIEKNPLEEYVPLRIIKISKDAYHQPKQEEEKSHRFVNNLSVNKTKQAMIEEAFSMGRNNMQIPLPPRNVADVHSGWWKKTGVPHDLRHKQLENDQFHETVHNPGLTKQSLKRKKTPLTRKAQVLSRMAEKVVGRAATRVNSRTADSAHRIITTLPPVTRRPTTTTRIPIQTKQRISDSHKNQKESGDTPTTASSFSKEVKQPDHSNIFHSTVKEEEDIVTFPTTKLTFPSTTEVHTLRGFRKPLKVLRTTVFYPLVTTTQRPSTTTTKTVRIPKMRKRNRWGARLARLEQKGEATIRKTDKNSRKTIDLPSNTRERKFSNKNKKPFVPSITPFSKPSRSGNLIRNNNQQNSSVEVRLGTKVTISMDSGGKSESTFEVGRGAEVPNRLPWKEEEKGSQRLRYGASKERSSSAEIKMDNIKNHPNLLNNYTISVRKVTNDYTELPTNNATHKKRSLRVNSFSGQNKTHNIKQAIYIAGYKPNGTGKYSRNQGRNIYEVDVRNSSYSNELTTENDAQYSLGKVPGFTTRMRTVAVSTPFTPTTQNTDNWTPASTTLSTRNANDVIALNKQPEVHERFGERFEILNTIGTRKRRPVPLQTARRETL